MADLDKKDVQKQMDEKKTEAPKTSAEVMKDVMAQKAAEAHKTEAAEDGKKSPADIMKDVLAQSQRSSAELNKVVAGEAETTAKFVDGEEKIPEDPKVAPETKGRVSYAKEPVEVVMKTFEKDGKSEEKKIGKFDCWDPEKKTHTFVFREIVMVNEINSEAKEEIRKLNKNLQESQMETIAKIKSNEPVKVALQNFNKDHSYWINPLVTNNLGVDAKIKKKRANKENPTDRNVVSITELSPGSAKWHVICVPERAYDAVNNPQTIDQETLNSILNEQNPKMKVVILPSTDYLVAHMNSIAGPLKVPAQFFDSNTGKYGKLSDIPAKAGIPGGQEFILYELNKAKVDLRSKSDVSKLPMETDEEFERRKERNRKKRENARKLESGAFTDLRERAALIKSTNNSRASLVSSTNYLPLNTYNTLSLPRTPMNKDDAELQGAIALSTKYFRGAVGNDATLDRDATKFILVEDQQVTDSVLFPTSNTFVGKMPKIKHYFKTRNAEGKSVKVEFIPNRIIDKKETTTANSGYRVTASKEAIGTENYDTTRYESVVSLFNSFMSTLPEESRCAYPTMEEIAKVVNTRRNSSNKNRKLSDKAIDSSILDYEALMSDFANGTGRLSLEISKTQDAIDRVKESHSVPVERARKLDDSLANRIGF